MSTLQIKTCPIFEPLLGPSRYKGAYGGRASGKSHFFAELAIEKCLITPGTRIVCVREIQKSLKESVKRLLEDKIVAMGVGSQFKVLYDSIQTPGGGVIIFEGQGVIPNVFNIGGGDATEWRIDQQVRLSGVGT